MSDHLYSSSAPPVAFLFFVVLLEQGGNFNCGIPLHKPSFPIIEAGVALLNIPSVGIALSKLLNERFKLASPLILPRNIGMLPDKLIWERSSTRRPVS